MKPDPTQGHSPQKSKSARDLTYRTVVGLFWTFSGSGVQAVLSILVMVILARLLRPQDFGLVGAASTIVDFSALFSQLGLGPALVQRPNLEEKHLRTAFTVFILCGVLMGGFIAISAPLIANFFHMVELVPLLWAIALIFPIQALTLIPDALLTRGLHFRWRAGISVVSYMGGYGIVGISLALLGFGVWALVGATLSQAVIGAILLWLAQPFPKRPQIDRQAFRELIYFGGGFTLARILNSIAVEGDNMVVGRWLGATALGLYDRAYQLLVFPVKLFGTVLDQVLFPSMAQAQHDPVRLERAYRRGVALIALIFLPASVVAVVLAPELILVLFGAAWIGVVAPFQVLAAGMLFRASYKISDSLARATGAVYKRAWRQGVYAFLVVGGAWIGQHWGIAGVAGYVLIALTVNFILMMQLSLNLISMNWKHFLSAHLPALWLALATLVVLLPLTITLRSWAMPPFIVLLVSGGGTGIILLGLIRLAPRLLLGMDGVWMLDTLRGYVIEKFDRFEWVKHLKRERAYP